MTDQGGGPANLLSQGDARYPQRPNPPLHMQAGPERPCDEGSERDQHSGTATADREQGARTAAAAKLHTQTEQEGTHCDLDPDRRHGPADRAAEHLPLGKRRGKQYRCDGEHQKLRADARHVAQNDHTSVGGRESEGRVIQHQPHHGADAEQRSDPPAVQGYQSGEQRQQRHSGQDNAGLDPGSFSRGDSRDVERLSRLSPAWRFWPKSHRVPRPSYPGPRCHRA